MKSSKKYISEYIVLKILRGEYKLNELVSSENRLAIKFNCSRLTSRSSLMCLSNISILNSFKGMGYIVSSRALDIIFLAKSLKNKAVSSSYEKIQKLNILSPIIQLSKNECEIFLLKNMDALNNLLSMTFIILDKVILKKYYQNNYKFDTENPVERIIDSAFIPSSSVNNYISVELEAYSHLLKELGYHDFKQVPVIDQMLLNDDGNCAIRTFNIVRSNEVIYTNINKILT
ncbi:MAG: hypothetical protein ACRCUM_00115 [Mycoplasmoidaceae bacterium]